MEKQESNICRELYVKKNKLGQVIFNKDAQSFMEYLKKDILELNLHNTEKFHSNEEFFSFLKKDIDLYMDEGGKVFEIMDKFWRAVLDEDNSKIEEVILELYSKRSKFLIAAFLLSSTIEKFVKQRLEEAKKKDLKQI